MIVNRAGQPRTMVIRPATRDEVAAEPWNWNGRGQGRRDTGEPVHGERRTYCAGCKCPACMEGAAAYTRQRRAARRGGK